jgi:DNA-binding response OmpR family regulator
MKPKNPKILLVEDEQHISFLLQYNLQAEGFDVIAATNGKSALALYQAEHPFDAIILDVNLPEMSGFDVLKQIRSVDSTTGILMLTARASESDRLSGITNGADDYLIKPFNLPELIARISRMIERAKLFKKVEIKSHALSFGPWTLDSNSLTLSHSDGRSTILTALESDLFQEFFSHKDIVLSREHLLKAVWGLSGEIESRTVDNFIMRLRKIIEQDPSKPKYLLSVRGRGYKLTESGDDK